jgi:hypothetical protein
LQEPRNERTRAHSRCRCDRSKSHILPSPESEVGENHVHAAGDPPGNVQHRNGSRSFACSQINAQRSGAKFWWTWQSTVPRIIWTRENYRLGNERGINEGRTRPAGYGGKRDKRAFLFSWEAWRGTTGKDTKPNQTNQPLKTSRIFTFRSSLSKGFSDHFLTHTHG